MHENVLQYLGNHQHQPFNYGNYNFTDDVISKKNSAIVQPMPSTQTPEKENQPLKTLNMSPILPGTGSVIHNVTRMLSEQMPKRNQLPASPVSTYSTQHFLSYRPNVLAQHDILPNSSEDSIVDVENDSHDATRNGDISNMTDSSISTTSPRSTGTSYSPSGSGTSSPASGCDSITSPETSDKQLPKKKVRTNYTPDQIQTLLKEFQENPYPDSETMEDIARDMGLPENKIKVWFQNKRARWRRRVNENVNTFPQHFGMPGSMPGMPMSPMMSPVGPYGFFPPSHIMPTSSQQGMPGYMNYPWMQSSISPNNNQTTNMLNSSRLQTGLPSMQGVPFQAQEFSPPLNQSAYPTKTSPLNQLAYPIKTSPPKQSAYPTKTSPPNHSAYPTKTSPLNQSAYPLKTSPQQQLMTQSNRHMQYQSFLNPSSYGGYPHDVLTTT